LGQQKVNKIQKYNKFTAKKQVNTRVSRRQAGLTCKGSLVQVHSSTPEKRLSEESLFFNEARRWRMKNEVGLRPMKRATMAH